MRICSSVRGPRPPCRDTDMLEMVAEVDGDALLSSGPEYCPGWNVRKEKELELSNDDEPDKDIWSSLRMETPPEEPTVDWFDGSKTPWRPIPLARPSRPSKLRMCPMLHASSPTTPLLCTTTPSSTAWRPSPAAKHGVASLATRLPMVAGGEDEEEKTDRGAECVDDDDGSRCPEGPRNGREREALTSLRCELLFMELS
jgi:hypothetical protein